MSNQDVDNAEDFASAEGAEAGKRGLPVSACPYTEGTWLHEIWFYNWTGDCYDVAIAQGRKARLENLPASTCPHPKEISGDVHTGWMLGYNTQIIRVLNASCQEDISSFQFRHMACTDNVMKCQQSDITPEVLEFTCCCGFMFHLHNSFEDEEVKLIEDVALTDEPRYFPRQPVLLKSGLGGMNLRAYM